MQLSNETQFCEGMKIHKKFTHDMQLSNETQFCEK